MKTLTIISHTEHYLLPDGSVVGLGSTVTEINHLLQIFDSITHAAMLHDSPAPPNTMPYLSDQITFVALPAVGGRTISAKLGILIQIPKVIAIIRKALKGADYFQFRAPTGIGVFVIPYLLFFSRKKGWYKYAGNWKQRNAPLAYSIQKWLLEKQLRPVTINGFWEDQPKHCLSFENPCLTEQEIKIGQMVMSSKSLQFPLELCFVGRLEAAKGVDLIIAAIEELELETRKKIGVIHLVGSGPEIDTYKKRVDALKLPFIIYGHLSRVAVHQIYMTSHAILLPSASEGFPKVIAEAMNYGCIPIVSNVSSISHYIRDGENGFVMTGVNSSALKQCLLKLVSMSPSTHQWMKGNSIDFIRRCSYDYYNQRILNEIL
ncbi:glycosyltransferase involved in cell wall biosynthesis [Gelidibacter sediminis]|uniref:Glycosyltransferase involved in cell wall biosynthesis n=1 Tax=Gelidibacter sediminis TaxID=1608710 RepID=A0A4R7PJD9_9FLAO|nr:glycosyltransferase [Gelidibacter sediminis]TDU34424.1 glycosyltransferase involved in cell wall biosynthesis [Gelidibacter sediminis]